MIPTFARSIRHFLTAAALGSAAQLALAQIPDFYQEPGLYPNREYVNQDAAEHIDPFTGGVKLSQVDIHIPATACSTSMCGARIPIAGTDIFRRIFRRMALGADHGRTKGCNRWCKLF